MGTMTANFSYFPLELNAVIAYLLTKLVFRANGVLNRSGQLTNFACKI